MNLLCDTCSIIMLLRIVPELFNDARFECVTIQKVRTEIFKQQRFRTKYPWLRESRKKIKFLPNSKTQTENYTQILKTVEVVNRQENKRTRRQYNLSAIDREIAAIVVANNMRITTVDCNLEDLLDQEFEVKNEQPLKLVNDWIEKGFITWTDAFQAVINDWVAQGERAQPKKEIRRFERLTQRKYPRR